MIDIDKLEAAAMAVLSWGNSDQAWLDTSEDVAAAVVGYIDEDGNGYPVATVDCDQYDSGDSLPLAKFYALANPQAVHELINRLREAEADRNESQKVITAIGNAATGYDFSGGLADYVKAAFTRLEEEISISNQRGEALETAWCDLSALTHKLEAAEKDAARFRWLAGTTPENEAYNETYANWPSGKLADCVDEAMKESA